MLTEKGLIKLIQHSRKNISNNIKNILLNLYLQGSFILKIHLNYKHNYYNHK